jgi:hypothetical protein
MAVTAMASVRTITTALVRMGRNGSVQLTGAKGQTFTDLSKLRCLPSTEAGHASFASQQGGNQPAMWPVDDPRGPQAGRPDCKSASISTRGPAILARPSVLLREARLQEPPIPMMSGHGRSAWKYQWTIEHGSVLAYAG